MSEGRSVVVVGSGASGTLVAIRLLERLGPSDRVCLLGEESSCGCGVAFGTQDPNHCLNVRARGMSAYPGNAGHFVDWLHSKDGHDPNLSESFAARTRYGEYLNWCLSEAERKAPAKFSRLVGRAAALTRSGDAFQLDLDGGQVTDVTHVVLATGNFKPQLPDAFKPFEFHPNLVSDPWAPWPLGEFDGRRILILGTGLTMADVAVSLRRSVGSGKIWARSRRGLLPQVHRHEPSPPPLILDPVPVRATELVQEIACRARSAGPAWRSVIDGCRSQTTLWWSSLSWEERRRLVKRIQPYWDTHRHRLPEAVKQAIDEMQAEGTLDAGAASIASVAGHEHGFRVEFQRRGEREVLDVDWVINCTGPNTRVRDSKNEFLEAVVREGLAAYDPLGMGLVIDANHATEQTERVFALGPLCRGCLWETTAIPEIRVQAEKIAGRISQSGC